LIEHLYEVPISHFVFLQYGKTAQKILSSQVHDGCEDEVPHPEVVLSSVTHSSNLAFTSVYLVALAAFETSC